MRAGHGRQRPAIAARGEPTLPALPPTGYYTVVVPTGIRGYVFTSCLFVILA